MRKLFPACLLFQDDSGVDQLEMTELDLRPGASFFSLEKETSPILLAGGFSQISPENSFPLSATLQLNQDLATFTKDELLIIAQAEQGRINRVDYRSYTMDVDNRVCVISDSAYTLQTFMDSYGGVLEIFPLLTKGFHPEIETVTELNLDNSGKSCLLDYQVKSPINRELCTYCGDCGAACPENCIEADLLVDFRRCTLCKECEQVCEAGAIDIHGALQKSLKLPAVILLGNPEFGTSEVNSNIFNEESLPKYFATLFPSRIDEIVTWNKGLCQYSGNLGRGCQLCLKSCSYGAIVQDSRGVTVDAFKCAECGACVAACPTGSMQNERFNDVSFVDYFKQVAIPENGTVVIGDEKSLHELWWQQHGVKYQNSLFLQYDTPESLSLFHYLFIISKGARRIVMLGSLGQTQGDALSSEQMALANDLLSRLYDTKNVVSRCSLQDFDSVLAEPAVGSFVPTQALESQQPGETFVSRRHSLTEALSQLVESSGRELVIQPGSQGASPHPSPSSFSTVICDSDLCTHCMACLNDCRIQSLSANEELLTLNHLGALCVGCGLCVEICPENALALSSEFSMGTNFFSPSVLAQAEPMACKSCGKVFGTKKSYDRVMAILSQKETVDTSHFEYCDRCRVVKLFEPQEGIVE